MSEIKPMPVSQERFLSLVEAFLEFSKAWGIKVMVKMGLNPHSMEDWSLFKEQCE